MKTALSKHLILILFLAFSAGLEAKIILPSILSDNMVLQQNAKVTIWGWSTNSSEKIEVWGSWGKDTIRTQANVGEWSLKLPTPKAGGTYSVFIKGHELIEIKNVLIGEVWLCSGQSNMEMPVDSVSRGFSGNLDYRQKIQEANKPSIRFFQVMKRISDTPQDDCIGQWVECSPETVKNFSATGYFFGKELQENLQMPIGLIHSSWGGTNAETWAKEEVVTQNPTFKKALQKVPQRSWWPIEAGKAYNAMIYPFLNYEIAGAIWYQGESNRWNPVNYAQFFPEMIKSWREGWNKDFPFFFVQISPFKYTGTLSAAMVREAQLKTLSLPNTGMAVTNDIGNLTNIHPRNKEEVGRRLALWALAKTYNKQGIVYSGPLYQDMKVVKNKIQISFQYAEEGLVKKGKKLTHFEIAGADKTFYPAKAEIKGNTVVVSSKEVKKPVAVRFAFSDTAEPNLFNKAGLPASAFRIDNWKVNFKVK